MRAALLLEMWHNFVVLKEQQNDSISYPHKDVTFLNIQCSTELQILAVNYKHRIV
jgi:hypothetical protein